MSSDWRALIHYVDEGGVIVHMEENTKVRSKQTQRGRLRWGGGGFRRAWGGPAGEQVWFRAQSSRKEPYSLSGACLLKKVHKEIRAHREA